MSASAFDERRALERLPAASLRELQFRKLNRLLDSVLPSNRFYAGKLAGVSRPIDSLEAFRALPFTTKDELTGKDAQNLAANHSFPVEDYSRFHRTSGTRGRPLVVLDTQEDWQWWVETWQFVLDAAEVAPGQRVLLAFSFGPYIGFWSAFDAVLARGALAIPGGGLSSLARLDLLQTQGATTLCCTPSYALHLAEVAREEGVALRGLPVRQIIVAGEPGGSLAATRERIETAWDARVVDHAGATELGPWGYADQQRSGLHVVESEFIAEFLSLETGAPAEEDELSELVLTTLGRRGAPLLRFRTGDLVRPRWSHGSTNRFVLLEGGVLGRADDMLIIRGVNIYPSALEQVIRGFPEVAEFRITATKTAEMDALSIEVEDRLAKPERIAAELQLRLGLRVQVRNVPDGSLPRFEAKGKRFIDHRKHESA